MISHLASHRPERATARQVPAIPPISEKGIDDVVAGDVASLPGCSVGAFHPRSRDKAALIQALLTRLAAWRRDTMDAAVDPRRWQGASIAEVLEDGFARG